MRFSLSWLKDYVDLPENITEITDTLTQLGLEIESVEKLGEGLENVVVGEILSIEPHPNAEKIVVCKTDVGGGTPLQICCGARNMKVGDKVPTALVGAKLPIGMEIQQRKLRGITSEGMMCSAREIGLDNSSTASEGLLILPKDAPVGEDIRRVLGLDDIILEIEVTPNRGDWASMLGIARELAAKWGREVRKPAVHFTEEPELAADSLAKLHVQDGEKCPLYCGRVLTNVVIGPSPEWMQRRLRAAGQRPINNVVDITNYVLLETGQPLHAFDLHKLAEHTVIVRTAENNERIITLDGIERNLTPDILVIADAEQAQCIAGVMGGSSSEVTQNTTCLFLECAYFAPKAVRKASRSLGLITESSQRFERGVDPDGVVYAINRACALMQDLAQARIARGMLKEDQRKKVRPTVVLRFERTRKLLGTDVHAKEQTDILKRLGFTIESEEEDKVRVSVPSWRHDVHHETDLIEEIARFHGYDQIPTSIPRVHVSHQDFDTPTWQRTQQLRRFLISLGLTEFFSWTFTSEEDLRRTQRQENIHDAPRLQNPLSEKYALMRPTLLPTLLNAAAYNVRRGIQDIAAFEIGPVFLCPNNAELPVENQQLCVALSGAAEELHWSAPPRPYDFFDIKGIVELLQSFFATTFTLHPAIKAPFQPGQALSVKLGEDVLGYCGKILPSVAAQFEIEQEVYALEINLNPLIMVPRTFTPITLPSEFPPVKRDLAVVLPKHVTAADAIDLIREVGAPLLAAVYLFDVYEGKGIPPDHRSLAFSLRFQSHERTLTREEIEEKLQQIVSAFSERLQGRLR